MADVLQLREYQRKARSLAVELGLFCLLWRRQGGKSTFLGLQALKWMAQHRGCLVTYASASLLMGREITFKESQLFRAIMDRVAADREARVETVDSLSGHRIEREDDFAEVFEAGRLETRLWHDRTSYSRTQVIAPNPATARGFSGFTIIDEIGFIRDFRDVWDAMEPIFSSSPNFRCVMATTPPRDEQHFAHELTTPPPTFATPPEAPACAEGRLYTAETSDGSKGIACHYVDVYDAEAAGVKLYDRETRFEITMEESRRTSLDREAWDRNYKLKRATKGTAACSMLDLKRAQEQPESDECLAVDVDEELHGYELATVLRRIPGSVGIGLDLATTTNETSNPTGLAVVEAQGNRYVARLLWRWKTDDPNETERRVRMVVEALQLAGVHSKGLWIDASNERFYAKTLSEVLPSFANVRLIVSGEKRNWHGEDMRHKELLGNFVTRALEDGQLALPAGAWVKTDWRLVRREKGLFDAKVLPDGSHADTFDGAKLATGALVLGGVTAAPVPVHAGGFRAAARGVRAVA